MEKKIVLLDPSIKSNGKTSPNLGDIIIYEAVKEMLSEVFPGNSLIRISTHEQITEAHKILIKESDLTFVGGSNLLTSHILTFDRLVPSKKRFFHFFPGFKNIIPIGVGWSSYNGKPDFHTRKYYKNIFNKKINISVRDSYTKNKLLSAGIKNVINTGCPTLWNIKNTIPQKFNNVLEDILFTLTDYHPNIAADNKLLETLIKYKKKRLIFFPQGPADLDYLQSLDIYKNNKAHFNLLPYDFEEFKIYTSNNTFNYIGTRLHCGIRCMQLQQPGLIIGIDNRALEIANDTLIPVVERNDFESIDTWLGGGQVFKTQTTIPHNEINRWKAQFKD